MLIKTTIEADLEGDTYFPQLDTTAFKEVSRDRVPKKKKGTRFMQRSVFGLFTALLGVLCVLSAIPAFRKKRYGLAVFLFLNAFTNLVNTIHAFYGTLF